jgi:hypothetical protein
LTVFDDMASALADLLNTTPEAAGFILGFATIGVFVVAFLILFATLRVRISPMVMVIPAAIGMAFVGLVAWWPPWAILMIVVAFLVVLIGPFARGMNEE